MMLKIKYKHLEIFDEKYMAFQVIEQDGRNNDFNDGSDKFKHKDFSLKSYSCPDIDISGNQFYIQGDDPGEDENVIIKPYNKEYVDKLKAAVKAFNKIDKTDNKDNCEIIE